VDLRKEVKAPKAAAAKTTKALGATYQSLRRVSPAVLCLAYLLADCGLDEKANRAANLSLRCLNEAMEKKTTAHDIEQLLSIASYFEVQAQYASCKIALKSAMTKARQLRNGALLSRSLLQLARADMGEGDYLSARANADQVLHEIENQPGFNFTEVEALNILADCGVALGHTEEAVKYSQESLAVMESKAECKEDELLPTLLTLSKLYLSQKDCQSAKRVLDRALAIVERLTTAKDRTKKAAVYSDYGDLALASGDLEQARLWYNKARDINRAADGKHVAFAHNLNALARVDALQNDLKSAKSNVLWSASLLSNYADTSFAQLSFAEQCAFVDALEDQTSLLLSICKDTESLPNAYGYVMKWKGLLIELLRRRTALQKVAAHTEVQHLLSLLQEQHREIKTLTQRGPTEQIDREIAGLNDQSEALERLISQKSSTLQVVDPIAKKGPFDLRSLLDSDEAIVDVVAYKDYLKDKDEYAAIVLTHEAGPTLIELGDASVIDESVATWRASVDLSAGTGRDALPAQASQNSTEVNTQQNECDARAQLTTLLWCSIAAA
jgi:tetratricopeptide (TPR) repeat protein